MRSTGFVFISVMIHVLAVLAIALSPRQISEVTKGSVTEVTFASPDPTPAGPTPAPTNAAELMSTPAPQPVAPQPQPVVAVVQPAPAPQPAPPMVAPVAKVAATAAPVAKPAPKKSAKPVLATQLPAKAHHQMPEKLDPAIDDPGVVVPSEQAAKEEAPKFVPVKESAPAEALTDQDTEASSADAKNIADPAPVGVVEEAPPAAPAKKATAAPAPAPIAAAAAPATSAAPAGDLGKGGATQAGAVEFTDLKQVNGNRAPLYPIAARREKRQGEVELIYRVTKEGRVADLSIAKTSGSDDLDKEAVRAISNFRFVPGQEGWAKHPVNFALKGDTASLPSRLRGKVGSQD